MILVDTSVWIDHFRHSSPGLVDALATSLVLCHPFVVGELACGSLQHRAAVLDALANLLRAPVASHDEVMTFVARHELMGCGIGWVGAHLLASAALAADARLWSRDKRLVGVAAQMGLAYQVASDKGN